MTATIHLRPEELAVNDGHVVAAATLELQGEEPFRLWYRLPERYRASLSPDCDHFVMATIFPAMRRSADLVVHGRASPSLLRNLEEFQAVWHSWRPDRFQKIEISADEKEPDQTAPLSSAISAFSGGLDSAFTVYRHKKGMIGRRSRDLAAGVLINGFDIPVGKPVDFERALHSAAAMCSSLGMDLIPVATNIKEFDVQWFFLFGAAAASCLALLKGAYRTGLIAASYAYDRMDLPVGSNPVTDPMLSSDSFTVVHDGAEKERYDKIPTVALWPEAMELMRICYDEANKGTNCGRCAKCITTKLGFMSQGLEVPPALGNTPTNSEIRRMRLSSEGGLRRLREALALAKQHGLERSGWCFATRWSLLWGSVRLYLRTLWRKSRVRLFLKRLRQRGRPEAGGLRKREEH